MNRLIVLTCLFLAGCGADGAPQPPANPGVTLSGDVQIGVVSK